MGKPLILPLIAIVSFLALSSISYAYFTENAVYNDYQWKSDTVGTTGNYDLASMMFFSASISGSDKYFTFGNTETKRFDENGAWEATTSLTSGAPDWLNTIDAYGNSMIDFYWTTDGFLFTAMKSPNGDSPPAHYYYLMRWNITKYAEAGEGMTALGILDSGGYTSQPLTSLSQLYKTSPSWTDMTYTNSFVSAYITNANTPTFAYDFYNLTNHSFDSVNKKTVNWGAGTSDIEKFYVIGSSGNCFWKTDQSNPCRLHIIFEGNSSQAPYYGKHGIYAREAWRDPILGTWSFKDKGLITDSSIATGFQLSENFDYWTMSSPTSGATAGVIYTRVIGDDGRVYYHAWRFITSASEGTVWDFADSRMINNVGTNGFFGSPAGNFTSFTTKYYTHDGSGFPENCSGREYQKDLVNISGRTKVYFQNILPAESGWSSYFFSVADICDSYNASNCVHDSRNVSVISNSDQHQDYWETTIPTGQFPNGSVNITVATGFSIAGGCFSNPQTIYLDVLMNDAQSPAGILGPTYFVTEDRVANTETFMIARDDSNSLFESPNEELGIQTSLSSCICESWTSTCLNTTTRRYSRACTPTLCDIQTYDVADPSCISPTTITTTTSPTTTTTIGPPCTAGYKCYNSTHLCYKDSSCFWNLGLCTACSPYYCDVSNNVCFTTASCTPCPSGEFTQNAYPDCSCYCANMCVLGYESPSTSCACKDTSIDTSEWRDNPVQMFADVTDGLFTLLGQIAIPLIILLFAIGFGAVIIAISKRAGGI